MLGKVKEYRLLLLLKNFKLYLTAEKSLVQQDIFGCTANTIQLVVFFRNRKYENGQETFFFQLAIWNESRTNKYTFKSLKWPCLLCAKSKVNLISWNPFFPHLKTGFMALSRALRFGKMHLYSVHFISTEYFSLTHTHMMNNSIQHFDFAPFDKGETQLVAWFSFD